MSAVDKYSNKYFFGKQEACMMSAIAICYMLWHHALRLPHSLTPPHSFDSYLGPMVMDITLSIAGFAKICVCMFAMMSGYAISQKWDSFSTYSKALRRLWSFLNAYWFSVIVFLVIAFFLGYSMPHGMQILKLFKLI